MDFGIDFVFLLFLRLQSFEAPSMAATVTDSASTSKPPSYLQAYHCSQVTLIPISSQLQSGKLHPLSSYLSYAHLSPSYKTFCCSISTIVEPTHYYQVVSNPNGKLL